MDVCCGLGTVSLAGKALSKAVAASAMGDTRGFKVAQPTPHAKSLKSNSTQS